MEEGEIEKFRLKVGTNLSPESLRVRSGNVLVAVNDADDVSHLQKVMTSTDPKKVDVVVLSVNQQAAEKGHDDEKLAERVVDEYEARLFSRVVHIAEKLGKPASLVAVPGADPYSLIMQAAQKLRSSSIVMGASPSKSPADQQREVRQAWEQLPSPRLKVLVKILEDTHQRSHQIDLGST
jgi:hypothetical protein